MLDSGRILPGKVLVKPIAQEEKKGSIYIPGNLKPKTFAGEVIIVGENTPNLPMVVKPGNKILHSPHSFVALEIGEIEYRLLNQNDVLWIWD